MADEQEQAADAFRVVDVTRRTILLGLGAAAIATPGAAQDEMLRVDWVRDPLAGPQGWGLDLTYGKRLWQLRPRSFGPGARITDFKPSGKGTIESLRVTVSGASFLTKETAYEITFEITQTEVGWTLRLHPGAWLEGHAKGASTPVDLGSFMDDGQPNASPSFSLSVAQAEVLRERLFGDRAQVNKPLLMRFAKDASWTLSAQPIRAKDGTETKPTDSIAVLKGAGHVEDLRLRLVDAGTAPGASLREFRRPGFKDRLALVATAAFTPSGQPLILGEGGECALHLHPERHKVSGGAAQTLRFALRHEGEPKKTMAMLRASFRAELKPRSGLDLPVSAFRIEDGLITRQFDSEAEANLPPKDHGRGRFDPGIRHRLRGALAADDARLDTPYGNFGIAGDPIQPAAIPTPVPATPIPLGGATLVGAAPAPAPKIQGDLQDFSATLPSTGTMVRAETISDEFSAFELRALVRSYDLALADPVEDRVWSRLDFEGTETAFVLAHLARREGATVPLNAPGVVELGGAPLNVDEWPSASGDFRRIPVELALDGARLNARRAVDLLTLDFQFQRLALQVAKGRARIVPTGRRGLGGAGTAKAVEHAPPLTYDTRARLIVTLPPQHVAEKAYLRRINEGVELPDVPADLAAELKLFAKAACWRSERINTRETERKKAQKSIEEARAADGSARAEKFNAVVKLLRDLDAGTAWEDVLGPAPRKP